MRINRSKPLSLNVRQLMVQIIVAVVLLTVAPVSASAVPVDVPLWRLEGRWLYPPKEAGPLGRTAPAIILEFRSNGEFVEHHCWVIEGEGEVNWGHTFGLVRRQR